MADLGFGPLRLVDSFPVTMSGAARCCMSARSRHVHASVLCPSRDIRTFPLRRQCLCT